VYTASSEFYVYQTLANVLLKVKGKGLNGLTPEETLDVASKITLIIEIRHSAF
jgi:hypothetical protein